MTRRLFPRSSVSQASLEVARPSRWLSAWGASFLAALTAPVACASSQGVAPSEVPSAGGTDAREEEKPTVPTAELPYSSEVPALLPISSTVLEAEEAETTGVVSAVSTAVHTPGAEASARRYVTLAPGQRITWRTTVAADALVVRYSFPDAPTGGGLDGTLNLESGGVTLGSLAVTSRYSWEYGKPAWGTKNVWPSEPSAGLPRHFWDESSMRLVRGVPSGATINLVNPAKSGQTILIDMLELETVPAVVSAPANSLSLASYHPVADGVTDDSAVLLAALADATSQGKVLYVPEGTYLIGTIPFGNAHLQGAGLWRTRFVGKAAQFRFTGGVSRISDVALFGETSIRNDQSGDGDNAFGGIPAAGSLIERVWVEHMKCAYVPGTPTELRITASRFRNLMADGVNLYDAATQLTLDNNQIRNSGDDSIAIWGGHHITVAHNRIELPRVANGIGLFGGGPFRVIGNRVQDTVTTGAGINLDGEKTSRPFVGLVQVDENEIVRGGAHESDSGGPTGAIRVLAGSTNMTTGRFVFTNNRVVAPLESAVSIQGPFRISNLRFKGLTVEDAPFVADVRSNAVGNAIFEDVTVVGQQAAWRDESAGTFTIIHP